MPEPGHPLELRILGPIEALRDRALVDLGPRRQRAVLARLLLAGGRPVSVDRLIEDVWGGRPPEGAVRTLRSYLSRLRSALGAEVIVTRAPGYALAIDPDAIDAARFESLAAGGRELLRRQSAAAAAERLRTALSLWRGDALADLPPEPFITAEASRLEELRVEALEDRIEADLALGRHTAVVTELEALVEEHPLRERLWGQLMTALYRSGRQADALAAYQRARAGLDVQLGLEPGPELRRLETAILRQELEGAQADPPHNLPTPLTTFVGRERELAELAERLARHRLVTVAGVGGSGKTRLAIEAARNAIGRFADGVWMVELSALSEPALVAQTVAAAVDVELGGRPADAAIIADHLVRSRALILMDNCEHLVEASAALVERLLEACPELHVLATSREPLGVPGEFVYELDPLSAPPPGDSTSPEDYDAVRLFLERAQRQPGAEALDAVAQICRELDGLPLAIEIAAAQTRLLSPPQIADRLADRFHLLTYWSRTAVARHQTLRASLDWSDALLQPHERQLFHRLSVFAGGFAIDAVEAVAEEPEATVEILRKLVDASLVTREQIPGGARFRLLETVRQYGSERLRAADAADDAARRHACFFAALAERALLTADTPDEPAVYAAVDLEHANLLAALEWCLQASEPALLARIARGLGNYWRLRGFADEAELWLGRAIEVCTHEPPAVVADLHGSLGRIRLWSRSDPDAAHEPLTAAISLARRGGSPAQTGRWLHWLALSCRMRGDLARTRELLEESLQLARADGDPFAASHRLGGLSHLAVDEGRLDDADRLLAEAWEIIQPAPPGHRVPYLDSAARLALARGDLVLGARHAEAGLAAAREMGDKLHVALNLTSLAHVARGRGELDHATELLAEAVDLVQAGGCWPLAELLEVLAGVLVDRRRPERALHLLAAARAQRARTPEPFIPLSVPAANDRQRAWSLAGEEAAGAAWAAGLAMQLDEALELARLTLADDPTSLSRAPAAPGPPPPSAASPGASRSRSARGRLP